MPYFRIQRSWSFRMKTMHDLRLDIREGFFNDTLHVYVDDRLVVDARVGAVALQGYAVFDVDGRTLDCRWLWNMWTGNPRSIVIMHKDRILAQYGTDAATSDDILRD